MRPGTSVLLRFVERLGTWRVSFVIYRNRRAFRRAVGVSSHCTGAYVPAGHPKATRSLGTLHLPVSADPGTVAHEAMHAIFDWMKVRRFTPSQALDNEERSADYLAALVRRHYYELGKAAGL
jgi:hypothetical protein